MIAIIDYGMGNLRSVSKAFEVLGHSAKVTSDIDEITNSYGCVLPGVGAFGKCMENLNSFNLTEPIKEAIKSNKPFLGICLGLQLLFEESEESPGIEGLSIIKGSVKKFPNFSDIELKVPHMGWNQIDIIKQNTILNDIPNRSWFYFVHSYYPVPEEDEVSSITTDYGVKFTSAVQKDNLFACQFHPEKSSTLGLKILENFALMCNGN